MNSLNKSADINDMKRSMILLTFLLMTLMVVHAQVNPDVNYRQEGIASWYGPGFDGRPTASGEIFDSSQFTAAHPYLPFGTILTITNIANYRQVNVRINDRGPFVHPRIIDLSRAAAEILDMINTGTASVIVETSTSAGVGPVSPSGLIPAPSAPAATMPQPQYPPATAVYQDPHQQRSFLIIGEIPELGTGRLYRLQVGAYRIPRNAVEVFEKLRDAGLHPAYERIDSVYRVVLARLAPEQIRPVAEILFSLGFTEAIIRQENW